MDYGTIGSLPCELSLNQCLIEANNPRLIHIVMSRYEKFKHGIKRLSPLLVDRECYIKMLTLFRDDEFEKWDSQKTRIPKAIHSHLTCCMTAQFRRAIAAVRNNHAS